MADAPFVAGRRLALLRESPGLDCLTTVGFLFVFSVYPIPAVAPRLVAEKTPVTLLLNIALQVAVHDSSAGRSFRALTGAATHLSTEVIPSITPRAVLGSGRKGRGLDERPATRGNARSPRIHAWNGSLFQSRHLWGLESGSD